MAMRSPMPVGVECANCGLAKGEKESGQSPRCTNCGRFAEQSSDYCAKHEVNLRRLPNGYTSCPRCEQKRRVEQERQEMMARRADPNMHPTVDSRRR